MNMIQKSTRKVFGCFRNIQIVGYFAVSAYLTSKIEILVTEDIFMPV